MKLSVIIPAYNEEKRITKTLESIKEYLNRQDYDWEVLVIDDGSKDKTRDVVEKAEGFKLNKTRKNMGKGYSIKEGMLMAQGDYCLFMDADNATKINELDHFWKYFDEDYDVVIGSRDIKGAKVAVSQAWYKELAGKFGNVLIQIVAVPGIHDTQCGFKIFSKKVVRDVFPIQKLVGWGFDVEVLALAKKFGYKIKEEPITWFNAAGSNVKLSSYLKVFSDLFKVRWWLWTGKYKINKNKK